ncbi:fasciclin domain-containing protein [Flagellimonas sp. HMM57]|uniref:fasciclin domain-containing protein n=1 Tax=unclassified Flagellimonas TaxID=2644544 RepID=UPI0013D1A3C9|nr:MULTISPECIES: fasciclin domain-containing protein [unclassified Flagellimonas]UII76368.1 fasciclin domain-containing protein [Flagellimonas sp. HMM57]
MRFSLFFSTLLLIVLSFSSCSLDDDGTDRPDESLADLISNDDNFQSLKAALEEAELLDNLDRTGLNTFLAPTDDAFNAFLDGQALSEIPKADLRRLLLVHIVAGEISTQDFVRAEEGYMITSSPGIVENSPINLYFNTDNGIVISGKAKIVSSGSNKRASNGILHQIDAILELPTLADFIAVDDRLNELEKSLTSPGQPDFMATLDTPNGEAPAPFTVFAPINDAFEDFGDLPIGDDLTPVLEHHVIASKNIVTRDMEQNMTLETIEGDDLTVRIIGNQINLIDGANNNTTRIIGGNLQASNGVLHLVDDILIPDTTN